jgi:hypothetical protein
MYEELVAGYGLSTRVGRLARAGKHGRLPAWRRTTRSRRRAGGRRGNDLVERDGAETVVLARAP